MRLPPPSPRRAALPSASSASRSLRGITLKVLALLCALLIPLLGFSQPLWAAPVQWREVTATADGRQWWDEGSLRLNREGYLTVLSRFQPAAPQPETGASAPEAVAPPGAAENQAGVAPPGAAAPSGQRNPRQAPSTLYVMEIDCGQALYRDRSINGFHQFSPQWQPVVVDDLIGEVITQACAATPIS